MRVIEVLPSRAFIDTCIEDFKESLADVDASTDTRRQQLPYVEFMKKVVASHDAWIACLPSRIRPVCLSCHSDRIRSSGVRYPEDFDEWTHSPLALERTVASIPAFEHPECGGMLYVQDTGIYVECDLSVAFIRYSSQGYYLSGPEQHFITPYSVPRESVPVYRVGVKQGGTWMFITDGMEIYTAEDDIRRTSSPPSNNRIYRVALTQEELAGQCASNGHTLRGRGTGIERIRHGTRPVIIGGLLGGILGAPMGGFAIGAILGAVLVAWMSKPSDFTEERLAQWFEKAAADHLRWITSDEQKSEKNRKDFAEYHKNAQKRWHRYHKIRNLACVDELTGIEFEAAVASLYERHGYEVKLTKATGDFGVDLLAKKGIALLAIQVKRSADKVGVSAVQEAFSGARHYQATQAVVVTNNLFTAPARELARSLPVLLISKDCLADMWAKNGTSGPVPPFDLQQYEAMRHDIDKELRRLNVAGGKILSLTANQTSNQSTSDAF